MQLYWATCIYSYSHKLAAVELWERGMLTGQVEGIAPFFQGLPGPIAPPDQPNVIVLQNEKPSGKGGVLSSLRSLKNSVAQKKNKTVAPYPSSSSSPSLAPPSPTHPPSYPLDFKIGVNGNIIELK